MQFQGFDCLSGYGNQPLYHTRETETIDLFLVVLAKRNQQDLTIFLGCF